jgi:hypothetical protein
MASEVARKNAMSGSFQKPRDFGMKDLTGGIVIMGVFVMQHA